MPPLQPAPLDSAMINAVLQKQGMPNTTENLNRIAQFHAVAPDLLAQYLGQGTDVALQGAGTNAAIDRSMAQTDPRLAQLAGPNPLSATVDPNTGMSNVGPGLIRDQPRANGGVRAPSNAGRRGVAPPTEPPPGSMPIPGGPVATTNAGTPSGGGMQIHGAPSQAPSPNLNAPVSGVPQYPPNARAQAGAPDDGSWADWLMWSVLGPAAYAAWKMRGGPAPTPATPQAPTTPQVGSAQVPPNRQLPAPSDANRPPPDNSGAPPPTPPRERGAQMAPGPGQTRGDVADLYAQTDAENARNAAQIQSEMKKRAAQESTRKTLEAGKRVFTGGRK